MRKPMYAVLATTVVLSAGSIGALSLAVPPAVAATSSTSCRVATGTLSFSPTLPKLGNTSTVFAKLSLAGSVSSCSGGGVSSGQLRFSTPTSKNGMNCATLAAYSATAISGTEVITWNTGSSSTVALKLLDVKGSPTMKRLQGTVTAGLFKKAKQSGLIQYSLPNGGCTKVGFSNASFRAINPLTFK